jgi:hypothetical protein
MEQPSHTSSTAPVSKRGSEIEKCMSDRGQHWNCAPHSSSPMHSCTPAHPWRNLRFHARLLKSLVLAVRGNHHLNRLYIALAARSMLHALTTAQILLCCATSKNQEHRSTSSPPHFLLTDIHLALSDSQDPCARRSESLRYMYLICNLRQLPRTSGRPPDCAQGGRHITEGLSPDLLNPSEKQSQSPQSRARQCPWYVWQVTLERRC